MRRLPGVRAGARRPAVLVSAVLVSAVLAGAPVLPGAPTAAAAQSGRGSRLTLASQTPWVGPGQELVLRLDVRTDRPAAEVELAVAVHRRVTSRSEFTRTLDGRPRTDPLTVTPATLVSELAVDAGGAVQVRLPVQDPSLPPDPSRLRLRAEGVYPVRVQLREAGGGRELASLTTHLVYASAPQAGGYPLKVALVLPLHAPPALRPDGRRRLPAPTAAGLAALGRSLEAYPLVPLTLLPTPETLDALQDSPRQADRETLAGLARAAGGRQVAAATYVPIPWSAFDAGLGGELVSQLDRGNKVIEEMLERRPDPRTWVTRDGLDERSVLTLRHQQVDRLVVPERAFETLELPITLTQPFQLDVAGVRRPLVFASDAGMTAHFAPSDDPVLAAHRLLADLAVVYHDRPSRPRGVVVVPPPSWRPSERFLDTALVGLATSTVVSPATLDDAFSDVPPASGAGGEPLVRRLAPAPEPAPLPAADIRATRRRLVAYSSMLGPDNHLDDAVENLLLVAQSTGLRPRDRRAYLRGALDRIEGQAALVQVPTHRSITLTARTGEIPVTILSRTGYPVRLQVRVASDKLDFPGGGVRDVALTRRSTTERFSVRARTSGSFPLRIRLVSPDGGLVLGDSRFTVRSTAASGVGVVLSAGAGAFLLVWWARHLVRGRRNRRLVPT